MASVLMSSRRSSPRRSLTCRFSSPRNWRRIDSGSLVKNRTRLPGVRETVWLGFMVSLPLSKSPGGHVLRTQSAADRFAYLAGAQAAADVGRGLIGGDRPTHGRLDPLRLLRPAQGFEEQTGGQDGGPGGCQDFSRAR